MEIAQASDTRRAPLAHGYRELTEGCTFFARREVGAALERFKSALGRFEALESSAASALCRFEIARSKAMARDRSEPASAVDHLSNAPRRSNSARAMGDRQTEEEATALSKDLTLSPLAPPPAMLDVGTSTNTRVLVTKLALEHR